MNPLEVLQSDLAFRLADWLLHVAWLAAIVGMSAFLADCGLRYASARVRHGVHAAALLLMLASLPAAYLLVDSSRTNALHLPAERSSAVAAGAAAAGADAGPGVWHKSGTTSLQVWGFNAGSSDGTAAVRSDVATWRTILNRAAPYAVVCYLIGVGVMLFRLGRALTGGNRLRSTSVVVTQVKLLLVVEALARRAGMRATPAVAWCRDVAVPVVVGVLAPTVLLPASLATALTSRELQVLLLHELAHIRRGDMLLALLQRIAESLLFFHPAVWYVSRRLSRERENCCDDLVLQLGCGRVEYASALVRMAELCAALRGAQPVKVPAGALAATGERPSQLKQRVLRVLEMDAAPNLRLSRKALLSTACVGLLIVAGPLVLSSPASPPAPAFADEDGGGLAEANLAADPSLDVSRTVRAVKARTVAQPVAGGNRLGLFVLNVATGEVHPVARQPKPTFGYCGSPCWSADGRQIVFDATPGKSWNQTRLVCLQTLDGAARLADLGPGNCPTISPDGKQIAFVLNAGAAPNAEPGLWMMNADGTGRRHLGLQEFGIPKWSPDGRRILIVSFSNPARLTLFDVATNETTPVNLGANTVYSVPSWAGDGNTLVATLSNYRVALLDVTEPDQARVKLELWKRGDGLDVTPYYPVYSAASDRCVFVGSGKDGAALYTLELVRPGTPWRLEKTDKLDSKIASLGFSPDGRFLLFCSERD